MTPDEIIGQMETFTQEEIARINLLATGNVEDITQDDMELFSRWETSNALAEARFEAEIETVQAESAARVEQMQSVATAAIANLEAQAALARARLEAVQNGEI